MYRDRLRGSILHARLPGYWLHFACVFPAHTFVDSNYTPEHNTT